MVRNTGRISSAKARAVATALHRETAARPDATHKVIITRETTATGRGVIRFRAARIVGPNGLVRRGSRPARSSKLKSSR